jgi:uncharacterized protein YjiS (DUF1127 family)
MERTVASTPVTYQADLEARAPRSLTVSITRMLAFARASRAQGTWRDIGMLDGRARTHADAAARLWSLATWFGRVAARSARAFTQELRLRRDTRELMAMSDRMLKDIGLTRAEIGGAVRYGRD